MDRIPRATAVLTVIAMVFQFFVPAWAAAGATIEGTVTVPSDPSRVGEVASVRIRPVSGGDAATVAVDSSTGRFRGPGLAEGEYEIVAIGADGEPLAPEPGRMQVRSGVNSVVLSMQPPGNAQQDPAPASGKKKKPRRGSGLKDWHLTLIYFGVIGLIIWAVEEDDDEAPASPIVP